MSLYLGLDAGTTAAKAVVCDENGELRASGSASYPLYPVLSGGSEQDARDWTRGIAEAVRQALRGTDASEIRALSLSILPSILFLFSGVMSHSLLLTLSSLVFAPCHIAISYQSAR